MLKRNVALGEEAESAQKAPLWDQARRAEQPPSLLHVVDNRQDAHLLLGRVHILILLLGHTRAQAIEPPTVLGIINTVLKKQLFHPEERHACQQRV